MRWKDAIGLSNSLAGSDEYEIDEGGREIMLLVFWPFVREVGGGR